MYVRGAQLSPVISMSHDHRQHLAQPLRLMEVKYLVGTSIHKQRESLLAGPNPTQPSLTQQSSEHGKTSQCLKQADPKICGLLRAHRESGGASPPCHSAMSVGSLPNSLAKILCFFGLVDLLFALRMYSCGDRCAALYVLVRLYGCVCVCAVIHPPG